MIDFACKQITLKELVSCGLGLTKAEYKIFAYVVQHKATAFSSDQIAKALDLDVSTVQRAVKKLTAKDVLHRRQINISSGGYLFEYQSKSATEIRKIIMQLVHSWTVKVEKALLTL